MFSSNQSFKISGDLKNRQVCSKAEIQKSLEAVLEFAGSYGGFGIRPWDNKWHTPKYYAYKRTANNGFIITDSEYISKEKGWTKFEPAATSKTLAIIIEETWESEDLKIYNPYSGFDGSTSLGYVVEYLNGEDEENRKIASEYNAYDCLWIYPQYAFYAK